MATQKNQTPYHFDVRSYSYNQCREQHIWLPHEALIDHKAKVGIRVQRCNNCGTKKHSVISLKAGDRGTAVRHPFYTYPSDYRVPGGVSRDVRGAIKAYNFLSEYQAFTEMAKGK